MMNDCIYRDALLKDIEENVVFSGQTPNAEIVGANKVISRIKAAPIADVAPVVHGQWLDNEDYMFCSICGIQWNYCDNDTKTFNCCPNCGARMDLEEHR